MPWAPSRVPGSRKSFRIAESGAVAHVGIGVPLSVLAEAKRVHTLDATSDERSDLTPRLPYARFRVDALDRARDGACAIDEERCGVCGPSRRTPSLAQCLEHPWLRA